MSSGAKRLVQSLRGRSTGSGRSGGVGGGGGGGRSDGDGSGGCGGAASTSATRLFHYDSGHELDEISVVPGVGSRGGAVSEGATTPATPCNCSAVKYGSGQTLYSNAGSVPAASIHRNTPDKQNSRNLGHRQAPLLLDVFLSATITVILLYILTSKNL